MAIQYKNCVVKVERPKDGVSWLGIFCSNKIYENILTCAHGLIGCKEPTQDSIASFDIYSPDDQGFMFQAKTMTADYCLDVMSLGEEDLGCQLSNQTPWDKSSYYKKLMANPPVPHKILFQKSFSELSHTVIEGFFFETDGITPVYCDIRIDRVGFILVLSSMSKAGSSGSPIFTMNNQLIGILTHRVGIKESAGVRLDLTLPQIVLNQFGELPLLEIKDMGKAKTYTPDPDGFI